MLFDLVFVSVFYSTHAQFFTTSEKKGEGCPSLKNFVTEQITECVLSCRGMENTTSLYDQQTKTCRCVAKCCLDEENKSVDNEPIAYSLQV